MTDLAESFAYCRAVTRHHAKSFFFSSAGLPKEKREAAYAIYAFCRHADDEIDDAEDQGEEALSVVFAELEGEFDRVLAGESSRSFAPALRQVVDEYGIERQHFMGLVKGVGMDVGEVDLQTWDELRDYCYHVASVVGLVMCPLLGLEDERGEEHAIELGIAMQLTNITRDIGEDFRLGRIYLPAEERERFGVKPEDLGADHVSPQLRELLQFQIARARDYYKRSETGIPMLARDGSQFTTWLMRTIYAEILNEVEKNDYDVLTQRASTSTAKKLFLAAKAKWKSR